MAFETFDKEDGNNGAQTQKKNTEHWQLLKEQINNIQQTPNTKKTQVYYQKKKGQGELLAGNAKGHHSSSLLSQAFDQIGLSSVLEDEVHV